MRDELVPALVVFVLLALFVLWAGERRETAPPCVLEGPTWEEVAQGRCP